MLRICEAFDGRSGLDGLRAVIYRMFGMVSWLLDSLPTRHLSFLDVSLSCYLCIIPVRCCAFLFMHAVGDGDEVDGCLHPARLSYLLDLWLLGDQNLGVRLYNVAPNILLEVSGDKDLLLSIYRSMHDQSCGLDL